jgi:PAS domain S-box-containing protein
VATFFAAVPEPVGMAEQFQVDASLVERAVGAAPVGVTITDPHRPDNPLVYVNDAFTRITGYDREAALGRNCRFLQGPDTDPDRIDALRTAVENREPATVELLNYRADGDPFWNEVTVAPLRESGDVTHFVGFQTDVTARKVAEQALAERTETLEHLVGRIDGLLQDVTEALMHSTGRDAGERAVVERIAATEPYVFAWFGEPDRGTDDIVATSWAGDGAALDDVAVAVGADDPTARAFRSGTLQTATRVAGTACASRLDGAASLAAAPISYADTTYGVLTVYAGDADAFEGEETVVVEALGHTIGAGVHAAQSQRVLVADTPVTLDLVVSDPSFFLTALAERCDCSLSYRGSVVGDDGALDLFFAATGDARSVADAATDAPGVEAAHAVNRDGSGGLVKLLVGDDSLVSGLSRRGVRTRSMETDGDASRLTVELASDDDPRAVTERVRERYGGVEVTAIREDERPPTTKREFVEGVQDQLTDRQFAALQTAYLGGYYDANRSASGDDLAASMGVSRSTFHQHRRAAERKVFAELFDW